MKTICRRGTSRAPGHHVAGSYACSSSTGVRVESTTQSTGTPLQVMASTVAASLSFHTSITLPLHRCDQSRAAHSPPHRTALAQQQHDQGPGPASATSAAPEVRLLDGVCGVKPLLAVRCASWWLSSRSRECERLARHWPLASSIWPSAVQHSG